MDDNIQNDMVTALASLLADMSTQGGWRNLRPAFLGSGENPPQVIVPPAEAIQPGMFYAYEQIDGAKSPPFQVLNLYAGLSYDNATANLSIMVGYPPKSNTLSIYGVNPANALTQTGGALPSQVAANNSLYVTPERFATHRLMANGSLTLDYTGGYLRFGADTLAYVPPIDDFVDLTDSVPTDADSACFVLVSIDQAMTPILSEGTVFPAATAEPVTFMPTTLQANTILLGSVYLTSDTTVVEQDQVGLIPDIYYAPPAIPEIPTTLGVTIASEEPVDPTAGEWWLNDSGSFDELYIRNSDNSLWNSFVRLGSPTRALTSVHAGQVGYAGVYASITIGGGVINLGDEVAAIITPIESETGTSDDLDTITITSTSAFMFVVQATTGHTITLKHGTGNIYFNDATDHAITAEQSVMVLYFDGKCFAWY